MFDWDNIETVLLDMDGTLLDLKFDNKFWLHHLPHEVARRQRIPFQQAKQRLLAQCDEVKGTLDWYCSDYWSEKTNININQLQIDNAETIAMREDVPVFLEALKKQGKQRILLTNAHPENLILKSERTNLPLHLDHIYSTHQFGYCKESPKLWQALLSHHPFNPERTLFIDDNEELLTIAQQFGIKYVLGIENPDSELEHQRFKNHPAINNYDVLTRELLKQKR